MTVHAKDRVGVNENFVVRAEFRSPEAKEKWLKRHGVSR
jgi:hypothetical protein